MTVQILGDSSNLNDIKLRYKKNQIQINLVR